MPDFDDIERAEFLRHFPVSHETLDRLNRYAALLREWNEKFNLVASSTLPHIWKRHFLDSAQLLKRIPPLAGRIVDLGSGAGFPGLVLNIMGQPQVHLVESTGKKCDFLRAVISEFGLSAKVHQERAEQMTNFKADVITARALSRLPELLKLAKPLMKKETVCLFLKGQQLDVELTESAKSWKFDCETIPSLSDATGHIAAIRNLEPGRRKAPHGAATGRKHG